MSKPVSISTVTPVYRGASYLPDLVQELVAIRGAWLEKGYPFRLEEAIFVDDASSDGSLDVLKRLATEHSWIRVVTLARNFGQHPATIAGILHSSGDWVFTLDEDLQHHPVHFEAFLRQIGAGASPDIVYAQPGKGVHGSWMRDLGSSCSKKLVSRLTANPMVGYFNSFRLMRGSVARAAASLCSYETYFDVALSWFSNRFSTVSIQLNDERFIQTGASGYNFLSLLKHFRRLLMSSRSGALRFGALLGVAVMGLSLVFGLVVMVRKILSPHAIEVQGWTSLFLTNLFFGGLSAFLIGVALEYLITIAMHIQGRPTFFTVDRSQDQQIADHYASLQRG